MNWQKSRLRALPGKMTLLCGMASVNIGTGYAEAVISVDCLIQ